MIRTTPRQLVLTAIVAASTAFAQPQPCPQLFAEVSNKSARDHLVTLDRYAVNEALGDATTLFEDLHLSDSDLTFLRTSLRRARTALVCGRRAVDADLHATTDGCSQRCRSRLHLLAVYATLAERGDSGASARPSERCVDALLPHYREGRAAPELARVCRWLVPEAPTVDAQAPPSTGRGATPGADPAIPQTPINPFGAPPDGVPEPNRSHPAGNARASGSVGAWIYVALAAVFFLMMLFLKYRRRKLAASASGEAPSDVSTASAPPQNRPLQSHARDDVGARTSAPAPERDLGSEVITSSTEAAFTAHPVPSPTLVGVSPANAPPPETRADTVPDAPAPKPPKMHHDPALNERFDAFTQTLYELQRTVDALPKEPLDPPNLAPIKNALSDLERVVRELPSRFPPPSDLSALTKKLDTIENIVDGLPQRFPRSGATPEQIRSLLPLPGATPEQVQNLHERYLRALVQEVQQTIAQTTLQMDARLNEEMGLARKEFTSALKPVQTALCKIADDRASSISSEDLRNAVLDADLDSVAQSFLQWFRTPLAALDGLVSHKGTWEARCAAITSLLEAAQSGPADAFFERVLRPLGWPALAAAAEALKRLDPSDVWVARCRREVSGPFSERSAVLRVELQQRLDAASHAADALDVVLKRPEELVFKLHEAIGQRHVWEVLPGVDRGGDRTPLAAERRASVGALCKAFGFAFDSRELLRGDPARLEVNVADRIKRQANHLPGTIVAVDVPPLLRQTVCVARGKVVIARD